MKLRTRERIFLGVVTVIFYLAVGALGLPVFAGPVGGLKPLLGPTAGFLFGFVIGVLVTGVLAARASRANSAVTAVRVPVMGSRPLARAAIPWRPRGRAARGWRQG